MLSYLKRRNEKTKSDSLELIFADGKAEKGNKKIDLVLINSDEKPVNDVFIIFADENNFTISREYDGLGSGERVLVKQFKHDNTRWRNAVIKYVDCYGNVHRYEQELQ